MMPFADIEVGAGVIAEVGIYLSAEEFINGKVPSSLNISLEIIVIGKSEKTGSH